MSIRTKLIWVFVIASMVIFAINLFIYQRVNQTIQEIDEIYVSNVSLNELSENLSAIQNNMYEYLNTKGSGALENYYRSEQDYANLTSQLNDNTTNNEMQLLEKNIKEMSDSYTKVTDATVQAKRGGIVEKYKQGYEDSKQLFSYINEYIYTLNNMHFNINSDNYKVLLASLQYLEWVSSSILIAITVVNIFLVIVWTRNVIRPLVKLAQTANEVSAGNFNADYIEVTTEDEIGVVSRAFNKMLESIREYIQKTKESMETERIMKEKELLMESHLKDAQLQYLQAQINPHFLFNSLNAGAQLAMMEGAEKTCLFVEKMADFFRYNVKKVHEDSTLEEEVQVVDNYIYILNVRFSDEIHFEKKIDWHVLQVRIPSIVLQPIVENAVKHGIREIDRAGKIRLTIAKKDNKIVIRIKDNGSGMTQDRINEVMNGQPMEEDGQMSSTGIGLNNVISRLRLYYGRNDVFDIRSDGPDQGTEVIITIPADPEITDGKETAHVSDITG